MSHTSTDEHTLWTLIKDIKFGMLTHRHTDGRLHSTPLTTQNKADGEGTSLYFFISRKSEIATCIAKDTNVNVAGKQANIDLNAPKFNLAATAVVGTDDPYPARFQVNLKNTDLASLPLQFEKPVTGAVTAVVEGSGEIRNWEKGSANVASGAGRVRTCCAAAAVGANAIVTSRASEERLRYVIGVERKRWNGKTDRRRRTTCLGWIPLARAVRT